MSLVAAIACGGLLDDPNATTGGATTHPTPASGGRGGTATSSPLGGSAGTRRIPTGGGTNSGGATIATGGVAVTTNSSSSSGGLAGSASVLPQPACYEIDLQPWNDPIGYDCGPLYAGTKLILNWLRIDGCVTDGTECYQARFTQGTMWGESFDPASMIFDKGSLVFTVFANQQNGILSESLVRLVLDVGPMGIVGNGRATLERSCAGRELVRYELSLRIGEDHRGPAMHVRRRPYLASHLVTWAPVEFDADEPLASPTLLRCSSPNECPSHFNLDWMDPTPRQSRPAISAQSSYPSAIALDPAQVTGQLLRVTPTVSPVNTDLAGNAIATWPSSVQFVDDQPLASRIDFDVDSPQGVVGPNEWVPSDSSPARCESQRCLMLGPIQPCLLPRTPTFYSVWFQTKAVKTLRVRIAVETDSPTAQVAPVLIVGQATAMQSAPSSDLFPAVSVDEYVQIVTYQPRANPDGIFTHTSGYRTFEVPLTWVNPLGAAVSIACGSILSPASVRLFVEWLELAQ